MKFDLFYPVANFHVFKSFGADPGYYQQHGIDIVGHNGIDLVAAHRQPVYAAHDGVCYPEIDDKGGNGVVIRTTEAYEYQGEQVHFKTIYWHLDKADAVVKTGQFVKAGDLIGYADNTGFSAGDHLHFGLKPQQWDEENWTWFNHHGSDGYLGAIDPMPFFNGFYATDAQKLFGLYVPLIAALTKLLAIQKAPLPAPVEPVQPAPTPAPTPEPAPAGKTRQELLYETAKSFIGRDASPRDDASDEVGCADSLQEVYRAAFGRYITAPKTYSTASLYVSMRADPTFEAVTSPEPGDIAIFPTSGKAQGHCGVVGKTHVMSNTSATGKWEANYTRAGWEQAAKKRGLPNYYFRPKGRI